MIKTSLKTDINVRNCDPVHLARPNTPVFMVVFGSTSLSELGESDSDVLPYYNNVDLFDSTLSAPIVTP